MSEAPPPSAGTGKEDPNQKEAALAALRKLDDNTLLRVLCSVLTSRARAAPEIVGAVCPDLTYVPATSLTRRRSSGVICKADLEGGLIDCPELQAVFNCKAFVGRKQLGGFQVGQEVTFAVFMSRENKPQAFDLQTPCGMGTAGTAKPVDLQLRSEPVVMTPAAGPIIENSLTSSGDRILGQFSGIVRSVDDEKGFGFITSDQLRATGVDEDCYVHKHWLGLQFATGSEIFFTAFLDGRNGRPRAKDLKCAKGQVGPQSSMAGVLAGDKNAQDKGVLGTFLGQIKSFNQAKGFGFIRCAELRKDGWDGDVYLHQKHAKDTRFKVGDPVVFEAYLFQGRLQGRDLKDPNDPDAVVAKNNIDKSELPLGNGCGTFTAPSGGDRSGSSGSGDTAFGSGMPCSAGNSPCGACSSSDVPCKGSSNGCGMGSNPCSGCSSSGSQCSGNGCGMGGGCGGMGGGCGGMGMNPMMMGMMNMMGMMMGNNMGCNSGE
eukprot:TRINITY_DN9335_c0_g1_i1.p1 TRINITY_DN9335_c0_g1~~TRINITY_DN9335_c0_g1_i1.p1  ORF type:complete len:487 (-),score=119.96 TRINITY_DN9335_c0_g1_i1:27-1487(-)